MPSSPEQSAKSSYLEDLKRIERRHGKWRIKLAGVSLLTLIMVILIGVSGYHLALTWYAPGFDLRLFSTGIAAMAMSGVIHTIAVRLAYGKAYNPHALKFGGIYLLICLLNLIVRSFS